MTTTNTRIVPPKGASFSVKTRSVFHHHENREAAFHHDEYDIVRDQDGRVIRHGVCPSVVDAYCDHLNACVASGEWTDFVATH